MVLPARSSPSDCDIQHQPKTRFKIFRGCLNTTTANLPLELHTHTVLGELDMHITCLLNLVSIQIPKHQQHGRKIYSYNRH